MARIVAARFDHDDQAKIATEHLRQAGFGPREYARYALGPAGRHALSPIGGDVHSDEGARDAGRGAVSGIMVGALVGLALGVVLAMVLDGFGALIAIAMAFVGALIGSIAGAMGRTHGGIPALATKEHPVEPRAGALVAVCVDCAGRDRAEELAIAALRQAGATAVDREQGDWHDGEWQDFDPRARRHPIMGAG